MVLDERVLSAATNRARGDWAVIRLSKRFTLFTFIVNRFWIKELSAKTECRLRDFDISNIRRRRTSRVSRSDGAEQRYPKSRLPRNLNGRRL